MNKRNSVKVQTIWITRSNRQTQIGPGQDNGRISKHTLVLPRAFAETCDRELRLFIPQFQGSGASLRML